PALPVPEPRGDALIAAFETMCAAKWKRCGRLRTGAGTNPPLVLEQYAAVFGPAHARDARAFGFEPRQFQLLLRDDALLAAQLVGKPAVLDQQLAVREHLRDNRFQLGVRPRLAYEPEDACLV